MARARRRIHANSNPQARTPRPAAHANSSRCQTMPATAPTPASHARAGMNKTARAGARLWVSTGVK